MSDYFLRFAQLSFLYVLLPILVVLIFLRYRWHKPRAYRYSLGATMQRNNVASHHPHKKILFFLRAFVLLALSLLIAKPQLVDSRSIVSVEGIDIMLVLDVSGSMDARDFDNGSMRIDVAKKEAIHFIDKRDNDAIGLVIFGREAVSHCPLTFDKHMLKEIVQDLRLGVIDADGTALSTAIITAANRLKHSKSKSKVLIVLTDGEPSEGDMDPNVAIEVARRLGIKIYTVGIGSSDSRPMFHPLAGWVRGGVNKKLLTEIARSTGGQFFMAENTKDMRGIYNTIDKLEKTKIDAPIFSKFYDIFMPVVVLLLGIQFLEIIVTTFFWFAV